MSSVWKKVHVEDANTTHGTITATLGDNASDGAAGAVELVTVGGSGEQELQRQTYTFGSNAFNSTAIGTTTNSLIDGAGIGDFSFDGSGAATVAVDIANATSLGASVASGDLLLVADISDSNNVKRTSVADIVGAVSSGVTTVDITGDTGAHAAQNGAVALAFTGESATPITVDVSDTGAEIQFNISPLNALQPSGNVDNFVFENNNGSINKCSMQSLAGQILDGGELTATTLTSSTIAGSDTFLVADGGRGQAANDISLTQLTAYFNDAAVLTNLGGDTNTDINVNEANLRARLAELTENVTIGDANDVQVTIAGDLVVNGTTTSVNSTTVTVADKNIELAEPSSAYAANDTGAGLANAAANGGGVNLVSHHGSNEALFAGLNWSSTGDLTGWSLRDTADFSGAADVAGHDYAVSVMEVNSSAPVDTTDFGAGVGTFWFDDGELYIRTT